MPQVFISYSRKDLKFVEQLVADLQSAGLEVWYDLSGLDAGIRWGSEIQIAIKKSQFFLVVLSPNSLTSKWVEREFLYAETHNIKVIPLLYETCELPMWLLDLQLIDMQGRNYGQNFDRLLKGLGVEAREADQQARDEAEKKAVLETEALERSAQRAMQARLMEDERLRKQAEKDLIRERDKAQKEAEIKERQAQQEKLRKTKVEEDLRKQAEREQLKAENQARRAEAWKKWRPRLPRLAGLAGMGILVIASAYFLPPLLKGGERTTPPATDLPGTATMNTLQPFKTADTPTVFPTFPSTITAVNLAPATISPATPAFTATAFTIMTKVRPADGMIISFVPAGPFVMGSDDGTPDEKPAHLVTLDAFWIDQTEVTNEMYMKCVYVGVCPAIMDLGSTYILYYFDNLEYARYPVSSMSWEAASTYCEWAGGRLPGEAEWEKAARGENGKLYPWGNDAPDDTLANFNVVRPDPSRAGTFNHVSKPVGSYPLGASNYGVLDMAGNLAEWVDDWYDVYPGGDLHASDNFGMSIKVTRGGSWVDVADGLGSTKRYPRQTNYVDTKEVGFRCVMDATP